MMTPGTPRPRARHRRQRRLRQGDPDPRGRRHPQRHDGARAAGPRREECNVLFHDAVRPLLSQRIIDDCVAALETYEAVDTAIPSADTIISVTERQEIRDVLKRSELRRARRRRLPPLGHLAAPTSWPAQDPNFTATDDCTVVLRYLPEVPIAVVAGDERNMKVTEPIDVYLADKLFQLTSHDLPQDHDRRRVPRGARGQDDGRLRRQLRDRRRHRGARRALRRHGPRVQPLGHPHPRRAPGRHRRRARAGARGDRPGRLRRQHGRRPAARGRWRRRPRRRSTRRPRSTTSRRSSSPRSSTPTCARPAARCCCSPRAPTPGAAAATASTRRPRPPRSTSPRRWPTSGPATGCGSTASTRSAPEPPCAPRPSARSPPSRCSTPRPWRVPRSGYLLSDLTGHVIDIRRGRPVQLARALGPGRRRHAPDRAARRDARGRRGRRHWLTSSRRHKEIAMGLADRLFRRAGQREDERSRGRLQHRQVPRTVRWSPFSRRAFRRRSTRSSSSMMDPRRHAGAPGRGGRPAPANVTAIHIPNSGWPGKPRNVGIDAARGEYVYFVDHDDSLAPEALERMYDMASRNRADVIIGKIAGHGRRVSATPASGELRVLHAGDGTAHGEHDAAQGLPPRVPRRAPASASPRGGGAWRTLLRRRGLPAAPRWSRSCPTTRATTTSPGTTRERRVPDHRPRRLLRQPAGGHRHRRAAHGAGTAARLVHAPLVQREMLDRVGGKGFASRRDEYRRSMYDEIHKLALERFTSPGVWEPLGPHHRVRSELLRAGRYDDLVKLSRV